MNDNVDRSLPAWLWAGLPIVAYFGQYLARATLDADLYDRWLTSENGITEQGTVVFLVLALIIGVGVTVHFMRAQRYPLAVFFGLFTLGCLYFGGEEASWGQHWFGWATPEQWQALNNQDETNLHNSNDLAGSLLDQLPRNLLGVAILLGGAIAPLVRRARGVTHVADSFRYWVMPGMACVVAGWIAPLASIPEKIFEKIYDEVPWPFDIDAGEVKELMIAVFLFIYILSVWQRLRSRRT